MNPKEHLDTLNEIRDLMQKSSRFLSLSGLSGVCAGVFALIGAAVAYYYLDLGFDLGKYENSRRLYLYDQDRLNYTYITFCVVDALCILGATLPTAFYFTWRKARRHGLPIWDNTAKRLMINLAIPLLAGGLFCLAMLSNDIFEMVAPATLIFYGLALLNGSKYTVNDIRYLAMTEIALGIIGAFLSRHGLIFWIIGFGVMHIIYGTVMYFKYER